MRALIVSDVHSNIEALRSVAEYARGMGGFDQIWSLGDLVGYGPDPAACIDMLRDGSHLAVAGNHDLAAAGEIGVEDFNRHAAEAATWTKSRLSERDADYLRSLPLRIECGDFTLAHGSPRDPVWEYVLTESSAAANFAHFTTKRCLVGHSHLPFICRNNGGGVQFYEFPVDLTLELGADRLIINPGSVGQPRDGLPTASFAIYDSREDTLTRHRAAYDIGATQERMRRHRLPNVLIDRLAVGR